MTKPKAKPAAPRNAGRLQHEQAEEQTQGATVTVHLPWFAYYVDHFARQTALLNPIELSVYYRFLESYVKTGYLPDDIYILQEIARMDSALSVFRGLTAGAKPDRQLWEEIKESTINKLLKQFFRVRCPPR